MINSDASNAKGRGAGFAYLWTLMLVAFMGVSLVIVSEIYSTSLQRDKEAELLFIGHQVRDAIGRYYEATAGGANHQYPLTMEDLIKDPRFPNTQRYLRKLYRDPITGKAEWGTVFVAGRIAGIYSLSEKRPIKQGHFDPSDIGFQDKEKYSDWEFTYPFNLSAGKPKTNPDGTPVTPGSASASADTPATPDSSGAPGSAPPPSGSNPSPLKPGARPGDPSGKDASAGAASVPPVINTPPNPGDKPGTF